MALTCPACRASNDIGPACRRCRADLSLLFALDARRAAELAAGRAALAQGDAEAAFSSAKCADGFRHGEDTARLAAAAALLKRDFAAAWKEYQRARSLSGG
jgi:hypothetical protein